MKLSDLGEFAFIERIAPGCLTGAAPHVLCGIGDDAAVVSAGDSVLLLTTDLLVERVHFLRHAISWRDLGYKALAVNLSDIAAMGGTPRDALVSIAVPADVTIDALDAIYDGLKELARAAGVELLGGDTTSSPRDLCVSIAVVGVAQPGRVLYRSRAAVDDRILVTGTLGDAAAGLDVLTRGVCPGRVDTAPLVAAHVRPELYLEEARLLAADDRVHAAIDLSDGIASDLRHVCRSSGVGAVLDEASLPLSGALVAWSRSVGADPLRTALGGGEDYRLLVTASPEAVDELRIRVAAATGRVLHDVGSIVPGDAIGLRRADGRIEPVELSGWDHFRSAPRGAVPPDAR